MTTLGRILLFFLAYQAVKGAPDWGLLCCSAAHLSLKGQPFIVQLPMPVFGEREATVMDQQYRLAFMIVSFSPQAFSTTISSLTSPWTSLGTIIPILQLPGAVLFRGLASLSGLGMAAARIVCVILIPFRF